MPSYQLAISNIAWQKDDDETVYAAMQQAGFTGLELAPTRIFSEAPYENLTSALLFGGYLKNRWGFSVPSLQSIWYGQKGNIFNRDPLRPKKLLMHKSEINKLIGKTKEKGMAIVPLKVYFKGSLVKVEIGLAKGKKLYDKRQDIAKKDQKREAQRDFKVRNLRV